LREDLYDNKIRQAQSASTSDEAYGLLKEATGVNLSIEHILFLATVLNKGGGDGNK
jgi:hypothetical protein